MKKIENSFYEEVINLFKSEKIHKINDFIKFNVWIVPLIYILGTLALLIRNRTYGLQFSAITLLQFALIVVYFLCFFGLYLLIEYNLIAFFGVIRKKQKKDIKVIIGYIALHILYFMIAFLGFYILMGSYGKAMKLAIIYLTFWPLFSIISNNYDIVSNVITIIFFLTLIINIPMSMGGFKGQSVSYYKYSTNEEYQYVYYGNYDGLYQFTFDDEVILIPIDSGYIRYRK